MHINEFQNLMRQLYFERDTKRGKKGTLNWLEEGDINAAEKEFADVLAWLASLANILNVDLEKAALSKYPNKCPKCGKNPCDCQF